MITNLEPDILECEVKWALESITVNKASGVPGSSPGGSREFEARTVLVRKDLFVY